MTTINWDASKEETILILKIARRAKKSNPKVSVLDLQMDIAACHLNGNKLRLQELLKTDDFNFNHDVYGISRHINRDNAQLMNAFLPRFTSFK